MHSTASKCLLAALSLNFFIPHTHKHVLFFYVLPCWVFAFFHFTFSKHGV